MENSNNPFWADFTNCVSSFTKTIPIEDLYIYIKLGRKLGLAIDTKVHRPGGGNYKGIFMISYDKDYQVIISLYGPIESMNKLEKLWEKLDINSLRIKIDQSLFDEFDKIQIG